MPLFSIMMTAGCEKNGDGITSPEAVTFLKVSSTDPVNDATYVILTQPISAFFSKTMNGATLTTATFTLMQGTTPIPGTVSCSDTTAIFTPDSILSHYTTYTATITTGVRALAGKALAVDYVWSFTTGGPLLGSACK
jgi:large repetitive protein